MEDVTGERYSTFIAIHFLKRDSHYVIKVLWERDQFTELFHSILIVVLQVDVGGGNFLHLEMDKAVLMDVKDEDVKDEFKL